jgi:hypothetical protein
VGSKTRLKNRPLETYLTGTKPLQNLIVLKEKLNETNFERILTVIWESSAQSLSDTIQISIEVGHKGPML